MRFYSDRPGPLYIWNGKEAVPFEDGVLYTTDTNLIKMLKSRYRYDEETVIKPVKNIKEPVPTSSIHYSKMSRNEIMNELKENQITFSSRMKKAEMLKLLEDLKWER